MNLMNQRIIGGIFLLGIVGLADMQCVDNAAVCRRVNDPDRDPAASVCVEEADVCRPPRTCICIRGICP